MAAYLRNWRQRARTIVGLTGAEKENEEKILLAKLQKIGVLESKATTDDALALTIRDVMERRLQTKVYKMGLANTMKQARQFITHGKVLVSNNLIDAPGYLVQRGDRISLLPGFKPQILERIKKPTDPILKAAEEEEALVAGGAVVGKKE